MEVKQMMALNPVDIFDKCILNQRRIQPVPRPVDVTPILDVIPKVNTIDKPLDENIKMSMEDQPINAVDMKESLIKINENENTKEKEIYGGNNKNFSPENIPSKINNNTSNNKGFIQFN